MEPKADPQAVDDWDGHWSAYGDAAEDNPAQQYRRRLVFAALGELGPGTQLVDIGSGQGDLLAEMHRRFPAIDLVGLEQSAEGIRQGADKVRAARFVQRDLLAPTSVAPDLGAWATHATCSEVIEHVDDPATLLANATAYLAPGCRVVITVPGGPRSAYDRYIGHRRHFDRDSLREVVEKAGLDVVRIQRAGFPVFNLYKLLVIARGKKLIEDVNANGDSTSRVARLVMSAFGGLFRFALADARWGWQLVAVATVRP